MQIAEHIIQKSTDFHSSYFSKGETICKQHAPFDDLFVLKRGLVKVTMQHRDKSLILQLFKPNDILLFPMLSEKNAAPYSIVAIEPSEVLTIKSKHFYRYLQENNLMALHTLEIQERLKTSLYHRIFSLTQKRAHGRVADALLYLADEVFQSDSFILPLARRELGAFTALTTESAIRILREMHNDKIIELDLRKVKITYRPLLEKISQFG